MTVFWPIYIRKTFCALLNGNFRARAPQTDRFYWQTLTFASLRSFRLFRITVYTSTTSSRVGSSLRFIAVLYFTREHVHFYDNVQLMPVLNCYALSPDPSPYGHNFIRRVFILRDTGIICADRIKSYILYFRVFSLSLSLSILTSPCSFLLYDESHDRM